VSGTLRLIGAIAVILLAGLGLLLALDLMPREVFETWALRGLLVVAILALASVVIGLLMKGGKTD
jgi:hypothetical protein